jgi:hypothetical protein
MFKPRDRIIRSSKRVRKSENQTSTRKKEWGRIQIGSFFFSAARWLVKEKCPKSKIDEVRIWNFVRSSAEIAANYFNAIDCNTAGLVACYHFNQGTPGGNNSGVTTLDDESSSNNDGSLQNFALNGNSSNWVASSVALPLELLSYQVDLTNSSCRLSWRTAQETNLSHFETERSPDGAN